MRTQMGRIGSRAFLKAGLFTGSVGRCILFDVVMSCGFDLFLLLTLSRKLVPMGFENRFLGWWVLGSGTDLEVESGW